MPCGASVMQVVVLNPATLSRTLREARAGKDAVIAHRDMQALGLRIGKAREGAI